MTRLVPIPAGSVVRQADPLGLSDIQRLQSDMATFALGLPQVLSTGVDNAMRWVVKAHIDANVCEPCKKNDKKTYRNRASAAMMQVWGPQCRPRSPRRGASA